MVPLGRWGQPSEVADAVGFLVSDQAGFMTGETLTIDGGASLGRGTFGFL
jgi:NAD(P)-dependent dehydrogenase (short-subunit alcohol dehydrogenase family)